MVGIVEGGIGYVGSLRPEAPSHSLRNGIRQIMSWTIPEVTFKAVFRLV